MNKAPPPEYLFGKAGFTALTHFIEPGILLAFDLDGTLAPIVANPGAIAIPADIRKAFTRLTAQAATAVITGRVRAAALKYLHVMPRYILGNHGMEGLPEWQLREKEFADMVDGWQNQLNALWPLAANSGIFIENKGLSIAIHYRHAQNRQAARDMIISAIEKLSPRPETIGGKCVKNLLPADAPDKGAALLILMRQEGFKNGFFIGDDETDENVFSLARENIFTVRVGKNSQSSAKFYLRNQREVARLLTALNKLLENYHNTLIPLVNNTKKQKAGIK